MNLAPAFCALLSEHGHEVVHWSSIGAADARDEEIMDHAAKNDFVVLTNDLDFGTLLAYSSAGKPSVIQARLQDVRPASLGPVLVAALRQFRNELEAGALLTILHDKSRVRLLPL